MQIRVAADVHAALAHALIDVWDLCPKFKLAFQAAIALWHGRPDQTYEEYLAFLVARLRDDGVEQLALDALRDVEPADGARAEMFEAAYRISRQMYERTTEWAVQVDLAWSANNDALYPDEPACGELAAAACTPPRRAALPTEIRVIVVPGQLGPPSWASLPYVMLHELICHANQASPMDTGDSLVEGWMDYAAKMIHDEFAEEIFPWAPHYAQQAASKLAQTQEQSLPNMKQQFHKARAARTVGRVAAETTRRRLANLLEPRSTAFYEFIDLSVQLNRVESTVADHRAFVAAINAASSGQSATRRAALSNALRAWLVGDVTPGELLSFR